MTDSCPVDFRDSDSIQNDIRLANNFILNLKTAQLASLAENVSKSYIALANGLINKTDQYTVISDQMTPLITVMKQYNKLITDPAQIFARDQAINSIILSISTSIDQLSTDINYDNYITLQTAFKTAVDAYFSFAFSGQ